MQCVFVLNILHFSTMKNQVYSGKTTTYTCKSLYICYTVRNIKGNFICFYFHLRLRPN